MPRIWHSVTELVAILRAERDALERQIEALERTGDPDTLAGRAQILLCRYLVTGDSAAAARYGNAMGWRLPSTNRGRPSSREYTPADVVRLFDDPPPEIPGGIVSLLRERGGISRRH